MLKKLDRYIIWNYLSTFFFSLGLFILIVVVFDVSERIEDYVKADGPTLEEIVFDYYFNFIPYFMNLFSPLFIFIAGIYFTSRMAYSTEFVAMFSSGISFYRLLIPYLIVGVTVAGASFYLNAYVIPDANKELNKFRSAYLKGDYEHDGRHIHRQLYNNVFMYMKSLNYQDSVGYNFALERFDTNRKLIYKLKAKQIVWDHVAKNWQAINWQARYFDDRDEEFRTGDSLTLPLPVEPSDFGKQKYSIRAKTNPELSRFITLEKLRGNSDVANYKVEYFRRSSIPFSAVVLVIIAFALASRKVRGGMGLHLGLGILLAFSYIMFLQFSSTLVTNADVPAPIALWIPNLIYFLVAIYLVIKAPK